MAIGQRHVSLCCRINCTLKFDCVNHVGVTRGFQAFALSKLFLLVKSYKTHSKVVTLKCLRATSGNANGGQDTLL